MWSACLIFQVLPPLPPHGPCWSTPACNRTGRQQRNHHQISTIYSNKRYIYRQACKHGLPQINTQENLWRLQEMESSIAPLSDLYELLLRKILVCNAGMNALEEEEQRVGVLIALQPWVWISMRRQWPFCFDACQQISRVGKQTNVSLVRENWWIHTLMRHPSRSTSRHII